MESVGSEALEVARGLGILMQIMCQEAIETKNQGGYKSGKVGWKRETFQHSPLGIYRAKRIMAR